jgi:hypothetical protein
MIETTALQTIPTYSLLEEEAYLQGARNIDELHTLIARVKQIGRAHV